MDQRERAHISTGLFTEDQHVLQAARHCGIIAGGKIKPPEALEIKNANQADAGGHHRDQQKR